MRLFIAIDCKDLKEYFIKLQDMLPKEDAKLALPDNYHLTLKFLGKVPKSSVEKINGLLRKIKIKKFKVSLDKIGFFPNENYIRVVWIGISPKEPFIELQKNIEDSLKEFNFKKGSEFQPHITLARVKSVENKKEFMRALKNMKVDDNKKIEVKQFKLIKSTLTPEGPVYEDLEVFK
ncbi:RNA 2',3'-cyclic phosphodiesterase [Candidatus Woesearchaeota archaeon]|nr:RNA 2',3'-cyclic phosphodiesterase [Candidatus Woesearchaeota archaeon]